MNKPTILIVPGGFTLPKLYSDVITHVASKGYSIQALHLPSVGYKTNIPGTMQDDAAFIASEISKYADEGKDVVLIAHSYGGLPATESTKGLNKAERQRQGKSGGLVRLAYISCIILPVGESDASVIMPDDMLPRAAPFEIRIDVCFAFCNLTICNFVSRTNIDYRMRDGYIRPIPRPLFPTSSTTYQRKRPKSGQR